MELVKPILSLQNLLSQFLLLERAYKRLTCKSIFPNTKYWVPGFFFFFIQKWLQSVESGQTYFFRKEVPINFGFFVPFCCCFHVRWSSGLSYFYTFTLIIEAMEHSGNKRKRAWSLKKSSNRKAKLQCLIASAIWRHF